MKVDEIAKSDVETFKGRKWQAYKPVEKFLKRRGYKFLNNGDFSAVFAKPNSKYVIKVSQRQDECYLTFAKWVITQKNNPWLPKIKFIHTFEIKMRHKDVVHLDHPKIEVLFITAVEKLVEFGSASDKNWSVKHLPFLVWVANGNIEALADEYDFLEVYRKIYFKVHKKEPLYNVEGYYGRFTDRQSAAYEKHFKKTSTLPKTIEQIAKLFPDECNLDLHSGNIMFRPGTKQMVLVDPLAVY